MFKLIKWISLLLVLLVVVVGVRILGYEQHDVEERVANKQAYLQSVVGSVDVSDAPNIVLVLFDDLGFGDLGTYGSQAIKTPEIDALADAGLAFNNYYAPSAVCTPSRVGLLTGRYPPRAGLTAVAFPKNSLMDNVHKLGGGHTRIPYEEILLPEVLQAAGYQTAMVGKWHMGDGQRSLPNQMGFEYWYGSPYSNDMTPFSIFRDEELLVEHLEDQSEMNQDYVDEAVQFVQQAVDGPFFLYYAHNFPHIPLYSSKQQEGQSEAGLYGDVVEDLDRGIGEIMTALKGKGFADNTLVIITSDNGPWFQGSPGPNRGRKGKTFDGGMNVPFIVHWPARIQAEANSEKSDALLSGVDLFPSILSLLGIDAPTDRLVDGENRLAEILGERSVAENRLLYYFNSEELHAIRDNNYKYQAAKPYNIGQSENFAISKGPFLFNMKMDETESYDTSLRNPDVFADMQKQFEQKIKEMEDNPRGWL